MNSTAPTKIFARSCTNSLISRVHPPQPTAQPLISSVPLPGPPHLKPFLTLISHNPPRMEPPSPQFRRKDSGGREAEGESRRRNRRTNSPSALRLCYLPERLVPFGDLFSTDASSKGGGGLALQRKWVRFELLIRRDLLKVWKATGHGGRWSTRLFPNRQTICSSHRERTIIDKNCSYHSIFFM